MSGFYAQTPSSTAPDFVIDDFWGEVSLVVFRQQYRVSSSYSNDAVERVLTDAFLSVTDDLIEYRRRCETDGYRRLCAVPSVHIHGTSRLVLLFQQAIYCHAKAGLVDTYRDIDTAPDFGKDRADDEELSSDYWNKKSRAAIAKIENKATIEAKLI